MKQVTDYYFDLQNIANIDDCSDNCNDNVLILFKQIIEPILKDNSDYDITMLNNDTELFKMTGGDGISSFPYKQFDEILDVLFQKSKFIQEKKDELYNTLFHVEKKNDIESSPMVDATAPLTGDMNDPSVGSTALPLGDMNDAPINIMQNQPMQVGGYKKIQKNLFKKINSVIIIKLTIYNNNNNNFKNSFIKKMRYSQ